MTYRRFKCGRCHKDIKTSDNGTIFINNQPATIAELRRCVTCRSWYHRHPKFKAKRQGET